MQDTPCVPAMVIPNHALKGMFSVGFRDKVGYGSGNKREQIDTSIIGDFPQYCYDKYRWMFPGNDEVNHATLRYDEPLNINVDNDIVVEAVDILLAMLSPIKGECSVLPQEGTKVRRKSASGPNAEYQYRYIGDFADSEPTEFQFCWEWAHRLNVPQYWKSSGKEELLKAQKVDDGDCRTFIFNDGQHRYCGQRMNQNFNDLFGAMRGTWSYIGFDRTHGGFSDLGARMAKWFKKFEGDCKKWDARMCTELLAICMIIRWICYKPEFHTLDNWMRLVYQYKNICKSLIYLSSGQILQFLFGNKSGQVSTSYDNTLAHMIVFIYEAILFLRERGEEVNLTNILIHLWVCLYGDDSLGGCSPEFDSYCERVYGSIPKCLNAMYSRWGMHFKMDECKVQSSLEGLKFIGGIFKETMYGWAHAFSRDRVMSAMVRSNKTLDPDALWGKWVSLLALSTFDDSRHMIRSVMQARRQTLLLDPRRKTDLYIPTDADLYGFWFGWESPQLEIHLLDWRNNASVSELLGPETFNDG